MSSNLPNIAVSNGGDIITQEEYIRQVTATTVSADSVGDGGLVVSDNINKVFDVRIEKREGTKPVNYGLWLKDIAQSHHFVVDLAGLTGFKVPNAPYSQFTPVKNISLNYVSYENMTIPLSIFGDFPILNRRRVGSIQLTCYDTDDNKLEHALRAWEASCFPQNKYVAYLEDIARRLTYRGYNTKGKETFTTSVYVIPTGSVSVSRDYSANDAKLLNFAVAVVGDGMSCATGNADPYQKQQEIGETIWYGPHQWVEGQTQYYGPETWVQGTNPNVTGTSNASNNPITGTSSMQ